MTLKGQASRLDFRLDKTELDFGEIPYTEVRSTDGDIRESHRVISSRQVQEREIVLANTGKASTTARTNCQNSRKLCRSPFNSIGTFVLSHVLQCLTVGLSLAKSILVTRRCSDVFRWGLKDERSRAEKSCREYITFPANRSESRSDSVQAELVFKTLKAALHSNAYHSQHPLIR